MLKLSQRFGGCNIFILPGIDCMLLIGHNYLVVSWGEPTSSCLSQFFGAGFFLSLNVALTAIWAYIQLSLHSVVLSLGCRRLLCLQSKVYSQASGRKRGAVYWFGVLLRRLRLHCDGTDKPDTKTNELNAQADAPQWSKTEPRSARPDQPKSRRTPSWLFKLRNGDREPPVNGGFLLSGFSLALSGAEPVPRPTGRIPALKCQLFPIVQRDA